MEYTGQTDSNVSIFMQPAGSGINHHQRGSGTL